MITDAEQAISTLHSIRDMGSAIAMDDFGTGYSSLSYLRRFPFDKIKIDQSFISELGQREDSVAIVRAATGLAKALGMEAVAEGIETEEQLAHVAIEGCSEAQGYLISRPMPAADVFGFLGVEPREAAGRRVAKPSPPERKGAASEPSRLPARVAPSPLIRRDRGHCGGCAFVGGREFARAVNPRAQTLFETGCAGFPSGQTAEHDSTRVHAAGSSAPEIRAGFRRPTKRSARRRGRRRRRPVASPSSPATAATNIEDQRGEADIDVAGSRRQERQHAGETDLGSRDDGDDDDADDDSRRRRPTWSSDCAAAGCTAAPETAG